MRILIAPNAFKNSLTANDVATAIKQGLENSGLNAILECFPIADGGDGTAMLIIQKCRGVKVKAQVQDPLGREMETSFGLIKNGKTAVIEMADASGIKLLQDDELNPMIASSYGTGQLIKEALDAGAKEIVVGMGGSATVDGGAGILQALGIKFLDRNDDEIKNLVQDWDALKTIDVVGLDQRILDCQVSILCDVDNKLLGDNGAAAIFGPQKGAAPQQVKELDAFLHHFTEITLHETGINMAELQFGGTAGGAAAGVCAYLNAELVYGIDYFLQLTHFEFSLEKCQLLITGEGALDYQTLQGKGPVGVAKLAKDLNIPVVAFAGKICLSDLCQLRDYFNIILPICNQPMDLSTALELTRLNLIRTATELGYLLKL